MADMKAYLAAKYMSGPKADAILARASSSSGAPKKKKRKVAASSSSANPSFIKDDDLAGWGAAPKDADEDDAGEAEILASDRAFRKRQKTDENSGWATVRGAEEVPADEEPQVVAEPGEEEEFKGGLMTAAQLKKKFGKKAVKNELTEEEIAAAQETIYRDASGRKIDTAVERAEAAKRKREREEKEAKKMQWGKGLVQKEDEERKKKELEELKSRPFARTIDDTRMNEDMKAEERWNDPAAAFLSKKKSKGPRRPEYTGPPPPPNRFGIKPGYRWDGVDRGNGFEKKLFQRQNERKRHGQESFQWSVDEM
ncbi:Pre-mRNA-splicing factor cwc26 [Steccherinum ochraceum]|uniref:Pre-mRNA-splicing factor cwc26 n=1 Tax=Steccherinum ochraceum TaxID=92696 RepID=A0A4R0RM18_9APHY|nr:Pre-mRNA-splicing factor cwc26 [Steccherinum ochraceum]